MQHNIRLTDIGPLGRPMSDAISACVHCGFCLPTCPTYQELGQEMDSPRGRIQLMKGVLEGDIDAADAQLHIDRCLGCLACETACPSAVPYRELIAPYRSTKDVPGKRPLAQRLQRWLVTQTLPYPGRFRWAVRTGKLTRWLRPAVPPSWRPMFDLLPRDLPRAERFPARLTARGKRRARVALLTGCVQRALEPAINRASADVLTHNGVEVLVPPGQGCCGSLAWHDGEADAARKLARAAIDAFPSDVDAVVVNAAGCGSGMHEYPVFFEGMPEQDRARELADKVVDISVFLDKIGIETPPALTSSLRVAYHDACHLSHGQHVRTQPRRLLDSIDGLELLELGDNERCCGSAGTYNIDQPEISAPLGQKKADAVRATGCDLVAAGNLGCIVQIRQHLDGNGAESYVPPVLHTIQVLDLAYKRRLGEYTRSAAVHAAAGAANIP